MRTLSHCHAKNRKEVLAVQTSYRKEVLPLLSCSRKEVLARALFLGCTVEQLAYIDTRQECLDQLPNNLQTSKGTPVMDVMRFFHGDGPEQQIESGEQRGRNNFSSGHSGDSRRYRDLVRSFTSPHLSQADRAA